MANIYSRLAYNFGDDDSGEETEEYVDDGDTEEDLEEEEKEGEADL